MTDIVEWNSPSSRPVLDGALDTLPDVDPPRPSTRSHAGAA
jgi:hypothetical protein